MFLRPRGDKNAAKSGFSPEVEKPQTVRRADEIDTRCTRCHMARNGAAQTSLDTQHTNCQAEKAVGVFPNSPSRTIINTPLSDKTNDASRSDPVPVPAKSRFHGRPSQPFPEAASSSRPHRSLSGTHGNIGPVPSSVAAVLASTSIPKYRKPGRTSSLPRRISSQQLMDHWNEHDLSEVSSVSNSFSMQTLLSPPDYESYLPDSLTDHESEIQEASSVASFPSLTGDEQSILSNSPSKTPSGTSRRGGRGKALSLAHSVDGTLEHPLSPPSRLKERSQGHEPSWAPMSISKAHTGPVPREPSSFKSNLTSSLSALRSSIRSLSNFAATPYALPEDHLSRGLFADSQRIQREMRPRAMSGPPSPELRRYLNPTHHTSPHSDFHHHGNYFDIEEHRLDHIRVGDCLDEGHSIALQDRQIVAPSLPSPPGSDKGAITEAGRAMQNVTQQPQREIRENSEWLRICVLEENMRRAKKFEGPGHARLWLPARRTAQTPQHDYAANDQGQRIPKRWVPLTPDHSLPVVTDI